MSKRIARIIQAERLTLEEQELLFVYRHTDVWYQTLPIEEKRRIAATPDDQRGRVVYELVREHWQNCRDGAQ